MKTFLTLTFMLAASVASAQTITCTEMGFGMVNCMNSQGQSTTITPIAPGMSSWSNNHGHMGTIIQPDAMMPKPTMPSYQPRVQPIQPLQPYQNPYAPRVNR